MAKQAKNQPSRVTTRRKRAAPRGSASGAFAVRKVEVDLLTFTSYKITDRNNLVVPFETGSVPPNGTATFYTNGPPGLQVTISLYREANWYGHSHDGGPTGTIEPASFTLGPNYPQNATSIFRAPDACGLIRHVAAGGGQQVTAYKSVVLSGLVALGTATGLTLVGSSATHPDNHSGTPQLVSGMYQLGRKFYEKFQKNLFVNDMSLSMGGLFDHRATWSPPHQTHRDGRNVDINWSSMTNVERDFFKLTAEALGFTVELHENPKHWHLIM